MIERPLWLLGGGSGQSRCTFSLIMLFPWFRLRSLCGGGDSSVSLGVVSKLCGSCVLILVNLLYDDKYCCFGGWLDRGGFGTDGKRWCVVVIGWSHFECLIHQ